jgi:outer membrane receptor protein involved in Fe transport
LQKYNNCYFAEYLNKIAIMRRSLIHCLLLLTGLFSMAVAQAQSTVVTGSVKNSKSLESVAAVSVTVKGTTSGTFTDDKGNFRLVTSQKLPFTLLITSVGYAPREVSITSNNQNVEVSLEPSFTLGDEVVVAASRLPERYIESPVSIERYNSQAIRNAAVPNFYDGLANFKGVDMTTSGLLFRTISTRGFNGSGNLRFNQLTDGMDNQAPGLNFSVGSMIGMTELDVDNIELLQGASSALYGPGGMNGTMLMTSKNPFKHQGLSFQIKQGVMHMDGRQRDRAPFFDWSVRWAKKVNDKLAFKFSAQMIQAQDWQANDTRNLSRNNVFSALKPGTRATDPGYDGVSIFGDEASLAMSAFSQAVLGQANAAGAGPIISALQGLFPIYLSQGPNAFANAFNGAFPAPFRPTALQLLPFMLGSLPGNTNFGAQTVSRTGYAERDLVDYNTYNVRLNGAVHYKLTEKLEASLVAYWGTGTTVYTGADRYSLKNLRMGQYKFELKHPKWFLRAYTTQENSGDSYATTLAALAVNGAWKGNTQWFQEYVGTYGYATGGLAPQPNGTLVATPQAPPAMAHMAARNTAQVGFAAPGSQQFRQAFQRAITTPISRGGAQFADATDLYHVEGQYNLTDVVKFAEVLVGGNFRQFSLNSRGTIFADTAGRINISEWGAYLQIKKELTNWFTITASGRYDKNQNFEGRFTPRVTGLIKLAKDMNFRLSYQTAYRFPSTQDQWINLQTPSTRLIGGLPNFNTFFNFANNPVYTAESLAAYRAAVAANPTPVGIATAAAGLRRLEFTTLKPESVNSYEVGFRGLITKKLLVDAYYYFSRYNNFIARLAGGRPASGLPAVGPVGAGNQAQFLELASTFTTAAFSFVTNSATPVDATGWGVSAEWQLPSNFSLTGNVSGDKLRNVPAGAVTFFNTPAWRYNIGFGNSKIGKNWGFNVLYRWQDDVSWEGTFGSGIVDAFGTLDAQISYRIPKTKSAIKLGGSNILNKYYISAFGNPEIGGMYYIQYSFNAF